MSTQARAVERATEFLRERVAVAAAGTGRLPSASELAARCGVSYATMWKAIARLRDDGVLASRGRLRPAAAAPHAPTAGTVVRPAWKRVAGQIESDVRQGTFGPDPTLPSTKELSDRYGVCFRTLRRSLESLAATGLLEQRNRRWHAARAERPSNATIVLVMRGQGDGVFLYPFRTWEYFRILESSAARAGVTIRTLPVDHVGEGMTDVRSVRRQIDELQKKTTVIGCMLWTMGLGAFDSVGFVRQVSGAGLPVAVLDESDLLQPVSTGGPGGVIHIRVGFDPRAGRAIGEHLLALGHRRVAYLTPVPNASHSSARFDGLRAALLATPDSPNAVFAAHPAGDGDDPPLRTTAQYLSPPLPEPGALPPDLQALTADRLRLQRYAALMQPTFTHLLDTGHATAWVCLNDDLALYALQVLSAHKLRVPEDISVCGFDNTLEATRMRLTSYDFNNHGVVHACLDHILNPGARFRRSSGDRPLLIEGSVVRRMTTGRVGP